MEELRRKTGAVQPEGDARTGETRKSCSAGIESFMAISESESPAFMKRLMEEVVAPENIRKAYRRVRSNRGTPGVDGMTVDQLASYLKVNEGALRSTLLSGTYRPSPLRRVEIPKPSGGTRQLGIPTVLDRLVQQMLQQILSPRWDKTFSEGSFGFRPGRSAHGAIVQAQRHQQAGYQWVVDIDLEKFFDLVHHDRLMAAIAQRVRDKRILKLIRGFLRCGIMEGGLVGPPQEEGTPQGGPLSPLLSNLVLDELDRELESRGHRFVRYADDCNVYVRSERAGKRVFESLKRFIEKRLRLRVNERKSAVARASSRKFLSFSFTGGKRVKRRIAPAALQRFRHRVRIETRRNRGIALEELIQRLNVYLRGWKNYFGFCETPSVLKRQEEWLRRRLRCYIWTKWKRGKTRYKELRRRGLNHDQAVKGAGSHHGPWHMSLTLAMSLAFGIKDFDAMRLLRLVGS